MEAAPASPARHILTSVADSLDPNMPSPPPRRSNLERLRTELDDMVASECLFCGTAMIRTIERPFVSSESEADVIESWRV